MSVSLQEQPKSIEITPDLIERLREMLTQPQTTVIEETQETKQIAAPQEGIHALETVIQSIDQLLPTVSLDEITTVISACRNGTARRDICKSLHWGAGKYTTIVKPVLDSYKQVKGEK